MTTPNLRLLMQHGPRGVSRVAAESAAANAPLIAYHAAAICALSNGATWRMEETTGRSVKIIPAEPPSNVPRPPNALEKAISVALDLGHPLSAIKNAAFTKYGVTEEEWAAVSWANVQ